jgi:DNA polymerase-3 subunit alpha
MDDLEAIGLLKMDFLGLRTLTILAKTLDRIRAGGREPPDLDDLPADDPETFAMLSAGEASGVFQLESSGMRELLRRIRPDRFEDLSTILALYRPGPMGSGMMEQYIQRKNGREPVTYPHPSLEPLLKETRGVVVYQEQVMRIANLLAGFSLSEADNLRKAMGKKKPELLAPFRQKFVSGCAARGLAPARAEEIWGQLEHFAGYGFNKSHTVAYAVITYQTAWLKRHHPREFLAALLTCEMADMDKVSEYVEEARRMGVPILAPDISRSEAEFVVEGNAVRYGLAAIKGVGDSAAAAIVAGRASGPYGSVYDLCARVDRKVMNRAVLEALVKSGALDSTGWTRARSIAAADRALALGAAALADRAAGQMGLFGADAGAAAGPVADEPETPEWSEQERMRNERETIGFYCTSHPLAAHERILRRLATAEASRLAEAPDRAVVRLGGMIVAPRTTTVRSGKNEGRRMAFFTLEDWSGSVECVLFTRGYAEFAPLLTPDRVAFVEGKVDRSREEPSLQVDRIVPVEEGPRALARGLLVRIEAPPEEALAGLKRSGLSAEGTLPLILEFRPEPGLVARVRAGPAWRAPPDGDPLTRLAAVPGVASVEYLASEP